MSACSSISTRPLIKERNSPCMCSVTSKNYSCDDLSVPLCASVVSDYARDGNSVKGEANDNDVKGKDFITTQDWSVEELDQALDLAAELKAKRAAGEPTLLLPAKTLYMIFFDASTRTRNSFETGITQLGGHGIYLSPDKMQISHGENARDTANVLSRYGEAHRHPPLRLSRGQRLHPRGRRARLDAGDLDAVRRLPPVPDPRRPAHHPREARQRHRGLKMGVAWTSAPNYVRPLSVPQSLILLMPRFGIDVTLACPPEFRLMPEIEEQAKANAEAGGARFEISDNFEDAFTDANVVVPEVLGTADDHPGHRRGSGADREVPDLALRRRAHGPRFRRPHLHAPAARRPRPRGHRRGHRRPAVGGLRRGRKPTPRAEGADGADDVSASRQLF